LFGSTYLRTMLKVASIFLSFNIQPVERQAHRRFSFRRRCGGVQLCIRIYSRGTPCEGEPAAGAGDFCFCRNHGLE
jgi:hypothetical protein